MRIEIDADLAGRRLDKLLVDRVPGLGRAGAKRLFGEGRVRVLWGEEGKWRKGAKGDVAALGETVEIELAEGTADEAVADATATLRVLLETDLVLVVDKPAGQPTAPISAGETGTLVNALIARYPEVSGFGFSAREPGLVHRIDTDTSGLVLAGRTEAAFTALVAALRAGLLDKRYLLVCAAEGLPEQGSIEIPLAPHPKDRRRVYACVHPRDVARYDPRPASTSYEVVRVVDGLALVEARATRATRHQIRVHFAALGHPLVGDALYGGATDRIARQALHAHHIGWGGDAHIPAFTVTSPLPDDIAALVP